MGFTQLYRSTDLNAPPLSGQANSLPTLLNAVLVNGYGFSGMSITCTSSSTTATATVSAANGLKLQTGTILTISGADQPNYNGTFAITVTGATTFTYTMVGTATTPATGTIVASSFLPVTSITEVSTTYNVVLSNVNATLVTGNWVTISGASPGGANGTFQVTVTDTTHFSYTGPGSLGAISGTIVYQKAPLGWTSPYTGTNAAVYRPGAGNQRYLQVIDNAATAGLGKEAQIMGFETMSAYNVGTNQFPTVAQLATGLCARKSTTADTVQRAWTLYGDDKTLYLFMNDSGTVTSTNSIGFGDFLSYKSGDVWNTFIAGGSAMNTPNPVSGLMIGCALSMTAGSAGFYVARAYPQTGTAISCNVMGPVGNAATIGNTGGIAYPNQCDSGLYVGPVMLMEPAGGTQTIRGRMRGMFGPIHNAPLVHNDTAINVAGLSGITLTCVQAHSSGTAGQVLFDTFGAW